MTAISIFDAGAMLAKERLWSLESCGTEIVKFDDFWKACNVNGLTTNDRKIKELWKGFERFGVAKSVNQYSPMAFDLEKFKVMMAVRYEEWRVK
mgnify:CR=1 FL=1